MKTMRRDKLLRLARAGRLVAIDSYSFTDGLGGECRWTGAKPVYVMECGGKSDYRGEGCYHVGEWDFQTRVGHATIEAPEVVCLYIHSNYQVTFRVLPAEASHA